MIDEQSIVNCDISENGSACLCENWPEKEATNLRNNVYFDGADCSQARHTFINPFLPDCKTTFFPDFLHFSMLFLNFQDLNEIAMPNSHLALHKEALKQHFEK